MTRDWPGEWPRRNRCCALRDETLERERGFIMTQTLSTDAIAEFRRRLRARHGALREEVREALLRSDNERYIELAGAVHDPGDQSVADLLADVSTELIDRHVQEIRDLEDALQRVASGAYGVCMDCGQPIEAGRLDAYPTAKRCYACQRRHEQSYAERGRPTM